MKVSSLTPTPMHAHFQGHSTPSLWHRIRSAYRRLDRLLTRIASAETGDFDAVKAMLDQDEPGSTARKRIDQGRQAGGVIWEKDPAWPTSLDCLRECLPTHGASPYRQQKWG